MLSIVAVADSSFYICFLDDIRKPEYLLRVLNCKTFSFLMGPVVKSEVGKSNNIVSIRDAMNAHVQFFSYYEYGELLRPFFSIEEIRVGEHEVIAISYVLFFLKLEFLTILDEELAKDYLKRNFSELMGRVTGTVGFIEACSCIYNIFSKDEGIRILNLVECSKFRVKREILRETIERIRRY